MAIMTCITRWFWRISALGAMLVMPILVPAANIEWTGAAGDGLWSNTANWSGGVLPGVADIAVFSDTATNGPHNIIVDGAYSLQRIDVSGGGDRRFNFSKTGGGQLTLSTSGSLAFLVSSTVTADVEFAVPIYTTHTSTTYIRNLGDYFLILSDVLDSGGKTIYLSSGRHEYTGSVNCLNIFFTPGVELIWGAATHSLSILLLPSDGAASKLFLAENMTCSSGLEVRGDTTFYVGIIESGAADRVMSFGRQLQCRSHDNSLLSFLENEAGSTGRLILRTTGSGDTYGKHTLPIDTRSNSYVRFHHAGTASLTYELATNSYRAMHISGEGNLWKSNTGTLIVRTTNSYSGRTMIEGGVLRLDSFDILDADSNLVETIYGQLPVVTRVEVAAGATFDLNGINQAVGGLKGFKGLDESDPETFGAVSLAGADLTINATNDSSFGGAVTGGGSLVKAGEATFALIADSGYTNAVDRTLRIESGLLRVTNGMSVTEGAFELVGGFVEADTLNSTGQSWNVTIGPGYEGRVIVDTENADITGASLNLTLAEGYDPPPGTVFTLLRGAAVIDGAEKGGVIFGYPDRAAVGETGLHIQWQAGSENVVLRKLPRGSVFIAR